MSSLLRSFADWMNGGFADVVVLSTLLGLVISPLLVLVHELGHATVGLARTEGLVVVRVGRSPARWRLRIGRLVLALDPAPARNEPAGLAAVHGRCGAATTVALAVAGPLAQAVAASAVIWIGVRSQLGAVVFVGAFGLAFALLNLVPFERHGVRSDGRLLVDAISRARMRPVTTMDGSSAQPFVDELADTVSRWLVLWTAPPARVETERRGRVLAAGPALLGYTATSDPQAAAALRQLAFAGWCWREVERGDFARIRETALDALHAATITGAPEPALTALATRRLAEEDVLGLASPGRDDGERQTFLHAAFARLPAHLRPVGVPEGEQRYAFRWGVALRDIERIRG